MKKRQLSNEPQVQIKHLINYQNEQELLNVDLDQEYDKLVECIQQNKSQELFIRAESLKKIKERKMIEADMHLKYQILNMKSLCEFEKNNVEAFYQKSLQEAKDQLIGEIFQEKEFLKKVQKRVSLVFNPSSSLDNNHRSLRSVVDSTTNNNTTSNINDLDDELGINKIKKKKFELVNHQNHVEQFNATKKLSSITIKDDLLEILSTMKNNQATRKSKLEIAENMQLTVNETKTEITINNQSFSLGTEISIYSIISQETFTGIITRITANDLTLRMDHGPRFAVDFDFVRNGRMKIF